MSYFLSYATVLILNTCSGSEKTHFEVKLVKGLTKNQIINKVIVNTNTVTARRTVIVYA